MAYIDFDLENLNKIVDVKEFVNSNLVNKFYSYGKEGQLQFMATLREQGNQSNINLFKLQLCVVLNTVGFEFSAGDFIGSTFLDIESHKQEILALLEILGYGDIVNDDNITNIVKANNDTFLESTGFVIVEDEGYIENGDARVYKYSNEFGNYLITDDAASSIGNVHVYYDNGGSYSPAFIFTPLEQ